MGWKTNENGWGSSVVVIESGHSQNLSASGLVPVTDLLEHAFGITALPSADQHFLGSHRGKFVGYAALVSRQIPLGLGTKHLYLLGLVAVDPSLRHQGIGTALVTRAVEWARSAGSAGVILNCGASMTGFYEKAGFRKIADRASYLRRGVVETDEDPVMLCSFVPIEVQVLHSVFLGVDF